MNFVDKSDTKLNAEYSLRVLRGSGRYKEKMNLLELDLNRTALQQSERKRSRCQDPLLPRKTRRSYSEPFFSFQHNSHLCSFSENNITTFNEPYFHEPFIHSNELGGFNF
jgi:hypothetical protein